MQYLESALLSRAAYAALGSSTFGGKRNWNDALGYATELKTSDYRMRYDRNSIAARAVEAFPDAT